MSYLLGGFISREGYLRTPVRMYVSDSFSVSSVSDPAVDSVHTVPRVVLSCHRIAVAHVLQIRLAATLRI